MTEREKLQESFCTADTLYGEIEYIDFGDKNNPVVLFSTGGWGLMRAFLLIGL